MEKRVQEAIEEKQQEVIPEQQELELTPEEVEEEMFREAAALAGLDDDTPTPPTQEDEADPVRKEVAEDPAEQEAPGEEPQVETAPPDPFTDASPELRQAWQTMVETNARLEHDSVSNRNRVSALQKKLDALEQQAPEPPEVQAPAKEPDAKPDIAEADIDMREFEEDFPEIYKAVNTVYRQKLGEIEQRFEGQIQQLGQQLNAVAEPVKQIQATEQDAYRKHQMDALKAVHPDVTEIQNSNEFWDWVGNQTKGIKALAGSVAAQDNIALLNIYKSQVAQQPQAQTEPERPPSPKRQPDVALPRVNAGGRPSPGVDPNDEDAAWKYWSENYDKL